MESEGETFYQSKTLFKDSRIFMCSGCHRFRLDESCRRYHSQVTVINFGLFGPVQPLNSFRSILLRLRGRYSASSMEHRHPSAHSIGSVLLTYSRAQAPACNEIRVVRIECSGIRFFISRTRIHIVHDATATCGSTRCSRGASRQNWLYKKCCTSAESRSISRMKSLWGSGEWCPRRIRWQCGHRYSGRRMVCWRVRASCRCAIPSKGAFGSTSAAGTRPCCRASWVWC
jgi:hypothetical protein